MAFLFGSRAKGYARETSDFDIGVYLVREDRATEQGLWREAERIVGREVDFVVLNRAPAALAWTIVRTGTPLLIRDRQMYLSFLLAISHEANAWYETARDYHRVFERSRSLSREDRTRLEKSVQFLEQEIADYEKFESLSWEQYATDRPKKREVERWAEQLMNAVIDVGEIILASQRRVIPETYRAIIETLGTVPAFEREDVCRQLAGWAGLRNLLAHEYLDYRWKELSAFIIASRPLMKTFVACLTTFLNEQEEG